MLTGCGAEGSFFESTIDGKEAPAGGCGKHRVRHIGLCWLEVCARTVITAAVGESASASGPPGRFAVSSNHVRTPVALQIASQDTPQAIRAFAMLQP